MTTVSKSRSTSTSTSTRKSKAGGVAAGSQRIRGQLPAHIDLPKWVKADQIRALQEELVWNPNLDVAEKLIEFALEQEGVLRC